MAILDVIRDRRSVRRFRDKKLSSETIESLFEAASWAPSAGNVQSCELIVVRDGETRKKLAVAALDQGFVSDAPIVFVFCANQYKIQRYYGNRGVSLYALQDAAASIENMLLAAHELGLGACWVGEFSEVEVKRILSIPDGIRSVALVPVGYPDEVPRVPKRELIVHEEKW